MKVSGKRMFGQRRRRVAALGLIATAAIIAGLSIAKGDDTNANRACTGPGAPAGSCPQIATVSPCPGRMTADGLACCAPGSTPTGDDTCEMPGGRLAASCPLAQLTTFGLCCPSSFSPQSDGKCQPANGSSAALACPLNQLNQSGLSCCPAGQEPQTDGSCAAPTCPGPITADGRACCAPGSTPTGDDTCQLPGGGLAASCPLAQLTYSGTCCPPSSTPQSDGTCQPHNGSSSASACPLGQLDKGGLTCCPFGQVPQANGSCQPNTPTPTCPTGFTLNNKGQCLAALVCPGLDQPLNGAGQCCSPGAQYVTTSESGQPVCGAVLSTLDACPLGVPASSCSCSVSGLAAVCSGPATSDSPTTPTCPPGATLGADGDGTYSCVQSGLEPSCPSPYVIFLNTCVLPDCSRGELRNPAGNCAPAQSPSPSTSLTPLPPSPLPPAPLPGAGCFAGYTLSADGKACVRGCPGGEIPNPKGGCMPRLTTTPAPPSPIPGTALTPTCSSGAEPVNGSCQCPSGEERKDGRCVAPPETGTKILTPNKILAPPPPPRTKATPPKLNIGRPPPRAPAPLLKLPSKPLGWNRR